MEDVGVGGASTTSVEGDGTGTDRFHGWWCGVWTGETGVDGVGVRRTGVGDIGLTGRVWATSWPARRAPPASGMAGRAWAVTGRGRRQRGLWCSVGAGGVGTDDVGANGAGAGGVSTDCRPSRAGLAWTPGTDAGFPWLTSAQPGSISWLGPECVCALA